MTRRRSRRGSRRPGLAGSTSSTSMAPGPASRASPRRWPRVVEAATDGSGRGSRPPAVSGRVEAIAAALATAPLASSSERPPSRDPPVVDAAIERHGADRIAVALDVRDGLAVGDGWVAGAPGRPSRRPSTGSRGAASTTFVVTAIDRDGLLGGPDLELLDRVRRQRGAAILASGGIRSVADLEAVRAIGCRGRDRRAGDLRRQRSISAPRSRGVSAPRLRARAGAPPYRVRSTGAPFHVPETCADVRSTRSRGCRPAP